MVRVGDNDVGFTGLDPILEYLYIEGWSPEEDGLGQTIIARLREVGNQITPSDESTYREALQDVFREFYEANVDTGTATP